VEDTVEVLQEDEANLFEDEEVAAGDQALMPEKPSHQREEELKSEDG
jgi:hypothetical protein